MSIQHPSAYKDVCAWELSDNFYERINPLLPKPRSRFRGRGRNRKHIGGRPCAESRKAMAGILYCAAQRLPVEGDSSGVWFRQDLEGLLSAMRSCRSVQEDVARGANGI